MAGLSLKNIYKIYPNATKKKKGEVVEIKPAVSDFCMEIEDKEFIVFVGPSGCGKSTTLRMVAGLEEITSGELYIDGKLVNDVEPKDRDIAMVFQNYALYPHMTVYENMAFALKLRKMPKDEIDKKVREAAEILDITQYLERKPKALSGGQRQRVALGRAIVRQPKVFLLDEPLSNLDAKLRSAMRTEITKLHHKLQTTFIYVTHDQVEAMTMGTRIVVMKDGFVQQIGAPQHLYDNPANKFVAGFIGTPQMNFFNAKFETENVVKFANGQTLNVPHSVLAKLNYEVGQEVILGIRPEDLHTEEVFLSTCENKIQARCDVREDLGSETILYADLDLDAKNDKIVDNNECTLTAKVDSRTIVRRDETVTLGIDVNHIHFFAKDTEQNLKKEI